MSLFAVWPPLIAAAVYPAGGRGRRNVGGAAPRAATPHWSRNVWTNECKPGPAPPAWYVTRPAYAPPYAPVDVPPPPPPPPWAEQHAAEMGRRRPALGLVRDLTAAQAISQLANAAEGLRERVAGGQATAKTRLQSAQVE